MSQATLRRVDEKVPDLLEVLLRKRESQTSKSWEETLSARKRAELEFHDDHREIVEDGGQAGDADGNKKYYATSTGSDAYLYDWVAERAKGKVFLDYACGNGSFAIHAAKSGAKMAIGIDISSATIENAIRRAAAEGDCEDTGLPAESVDLLMCCGMLHHLDLSHAFPEIRRILKPGGSCLACEALDYNPVIKLYRMMTPALRTEWEKHHILSLKDVRFAQRFFDVKNVRYWHLFSIMATPFRNTSIFKQALRLGTALDSVALRVFPLSLMAWMFTFELHKRADK